MSTGKENEDCKSVTVSDQEDVAHYKNALRIVLSGLENMKYKRQELEALAHTLGDAFENHEPEAEAITEIDLHAMFGRRPLHISSEFMRDSLPAFNVRPGKDGGRESFRSLINPDLAKVKGIQGVPEKQLPRKMSVMTDSTLSDKCNMSAADDQVRQHRRASLPHSDPVFSSNQSEASEEEDEILGDTTIVKMVESLAATNKPVVPMSAKDRNQNNSLSSQLLENESHDSAPTNEALAEQCPNSEAELKNCTREGVGSYDTIIQEREDIEAKIEGLGKDDQGGLCGEVQLISTGLYEGVYEKDRTPLSTSSVKTCLQSSTTAVSDNEKRVNPTPITEKEMQQNISPVFDNEILDCLNGQAESCEPGTPTASIDSPLLQTLDEELKSANQGRTSKRFKRRNKSAKSTATSKKSAVGGSKTLRTKLSLFEQSAVRHGVSELALRYYKSMTQTVRKSPQRTTRSKTDKTKHKTASCNLSKTDSELTKPNGKTKSLKVKAKHSTSVL